MRLDEKVSRWLFWRVKRQIESRTLYTITDMVWSDNAVEVHAVTELAGDPDRRACFGYGPTELAAIDDLRRKLRPSYNKTRKVHT